MAIHNTTEAVQQAARLLAGTNWLDQDIAKEIATIGVAVANMLLVVYYQAETGKATQADFQGVLDALRQALPGVVHQE